MWKTIIFHCRNLLCRLGRLHGSQGCCLFYRSIQNPVCRCQGQTQTVVIARRVQKLCLPRSAGNIWAGKWTRGCLLSLKNKCPWARQLTPSCSRGAALWAADRSGLLTCVRLLHLPLLLQAVGLKTCSLRLVCCRRCFVNGSSRALTSTVYLLSLSGKECHAMQQ